MALLLKRMGAADIVPPPIGTAWSALCPPDDPSLLPQLQPPALRQATPAGRWCCPATSGTAVCRVGWQVFLHLMAESACTGCCIVSELRVAEAAGLVLAAGEDKPSRMPATVDLLLRQPALTAPSPARRLDITPQASLRLFARL